MLKQLQYYHDHIFDQIQYIPYLNQGGCGIYCYYVGLELKAKGYNIKIANYDNEFSKIDIRNNIKNINSDIKNSNKLKSYYSCCHHLLYINGKYLMDSDNLYKTKPDNLYNKYNFCGYYSLNEMKYLIKDPFQWVSLFNRKYIKDVKKAAMSIRSL